MSETKTSKEVYNALIAAEVTVGDLVRFSNEAIGFVYGIKKRDGEFSIAVPYGFNYYFEKSMTTEPFWPTHFARPCFNGVTFGYESIAPQNTNGDWPYMNIYNYFPYNTFEIKYPKPEPLTLEQRIERLEKLQGVGK